MTKQIIGSIPEFTSDETPKKVPEEVVEEEVKQASSSDAEPELKEQGESEGQTSAEETETPTVPASEEEPTETQTQDESRELLRDIEGLKNEKRELLSQLKELRGERREAKKQEIAKVEEKIEDKLDDLDPAYVDATDRILRAKGYVSKADLDHMLYEARKQEIVQEFLTEYPEYNEANDPDRIKYDKLLKEIEMYKEPTDPSQWKTIFRRSHSAISKNSQAPRINPAIQKRQLQVASAGSGGTQAPSSVDAFTPEERQLYRSGGFTDAEIDAFAKHR